MIIITIVIIIVVITVISLSSTIEQMMAGLLVLPEALAWLLAQVLRL